MLVFGDTRARSWPPVNLCAVAAGSTLTSPRTMLNRAPMPNAPCADAGAATASSSATATTDLWTVTSLMSARDQRNFIGNSEPRTANRQRTVNNQLQTTANRKPPTKLRTINCKQPQTANCKPPTNCKPQTKSRSAGTRTERKAPCESADV